MKIIHAMDDLPPDPHHLDSRPIVFLTLPHRRGMPYGLIKTHKKPKWKRGVPMKARRVVKNAQEGH